MPGYTEENSLLAYRITLTDAYGFSQTYDFEHRMANAAIIHTEGGGDIIVEGELHHERKAEGMGERITVLCMEACALTAEPAAGYTFDGWYQDAGYDYKITDEPSYVFIPSAPLRHVYALFLPGEIQLDARNTANSYIAPQLLCDYSFDATVQGNGCATLGITPQPLSGAYARLIWESGTQANSIIASLSYDGRRISFRTGSRQGNALIGLFDAWGNCIWSWHIWVASYNPDSSAQTYASGAVFMDRNLRGYRNRLHAEHSLRTVLSVGAQRPVPVSGILLVESSGAVRLSRPLQVRGNPPRKQRSGRCYDGGLGREEPHLLHP